MDCSNPNCRGMEKPPYRRGQCNACYQRNRAKGNYVPRKLGGRYSQWRLNNPERLMLIAARRHAKELNVPFDLQISDIQIPKHCPILGIPLFKGGSRDNTPSLDRVIGQRGYVSGNVRVISSRANRIKSDASLDELERIVRYVKFSSK